MRNDAAGGRTGWANRLGQVVAGVAVLLALSSQAALAHGGGGVMQLASNQVAVGGTLVIAGTKFEKSTDMKLVLRGVLDNYPVGEVRTDSAGKFQLSLVLPPHVPSGAYTLVAIAPDGDVTARADVVLGAAAAATGTTGMAGMPGMGTHGVQEMPSMHATAEMMAIQHTTTPAEWGVIIVLIVAAFGGGAMLLRRGARRHA